MARGVLGRFNKNSMEAGKMTPKELFLFDLWGYVVIEDVLTPEEVAAANAAVEHHLDLVQKREPGLSQGADTLIAATGRGEFSQNPLTFERPWCCLLYTSPSPRDKRQSRMPSSA